MSDAGPDLTCPIQFGVRVEKVSGYKMPGIVVADFYTRSGKRRFVVECEVPECAGLLHIYSEKDLRVV